MLGNEPGWGLKVRVWVERNGRKVLGPGRVELLEHIENLKSISAAAKQMGMSYRRAWELVQSMNEEAGEPLVESAAGGPGGGGASLTPQGQAAIVLYHRLLEQILRASDEAAASSQS